MMTASDITLLEKLAKLIRYYILTMTTNAGSGHPTSSLSAVELMATLLFGGYFRYDVSRPTHPNTLRARSVRSPEPGARSPGGRGDGSSW